MSFINPYIFREYDVRGNVEEDFPEHIVKKLGKAFIVVEQNISLISQLNSDCLLMEKGVLTKKLNASEINSVEKARDLLSLHN